MKSMFVLVSECGVQLGDFLHRCINDKTMKIEGCNIERGKDFYLTCIYFMYLIHENVINLQLSRHNQ